MTPEEIEYEHKRFEAWWYERYGNRTRVPSEYFPRTGSSYLNERIYGMWLAWRAAVESIRDRQAQRQREAVELMERQEAQRMAMAAKHDIDQR